MPASKHDGDLEDGPREFGYLHEADAPRDGWVSLGTHEGRKRPVMLDKDSREGDEHAT